MNRLRIAVLGGGHLGRIHTRLLAARQDVELVGVVDPFPSAREAIAREFQVPTLADPDELTGRVDAVVVATPTPLHHSVTLRFLRQGVHAFVEKPITTTVEEADQLIAAARQRQLVLQAGHVERFNPAFVAVRDQLQRPRYLEAVRASGYTFRSTDVGVVLDLMIHDLDLVLTLADSPVIDVEAIGAVVLGPHEDIAHARLKFANGCVANLNASRTSFQPQRTLQVYTDRLFGSIDFAAGAVKLVRPDERLRNQDFDVARLSPEEKADVKENLFRDLLRLEEVPVVKANAIQEEHSDFVGAIRGGSAPQVTGEQGRQALAIAQEIVAQIEAARRADGARILKAPWPPAPTSTDFRKAG